MVDSVAKFSRFQRIERGVSHLPSGTSRQRHIHAEQVDANDCQGIPEESLTT